MQTMYGDCASCVYLVSVRRNVHWCISVNAAFSLSILSIFSNVKHFKNKAILQKNNCHIDLAFIIPSLILAQFTSYRRLRGRKHF